MPVPILIKRSSVAGKVPATTDLALGELAINSTDGRLFLKKSVNGVESVVQVSGNAGDLTGSTLPANIVNSSLTTVGTLTNLTVTNPIAGSITGNAATATKLQTARTINSVGFDGSANINFYDTFTTGQASPGPRTFPGNSIRGFDAYSSTDFPTSFYSGLTISGPGGLMSSQLAMSWNHSDGQAPGGIYFRVNDDNGDPATWSPWQRIATAADIDQITSSTREYTGTRFYNTITGSNQVNARNHFTGFNAASAPITGGWISAAFGDSTGDRVVIGSGSSKAIVGAHDGNLSDWAALAFGGKRFQWTNNGQDNGTMMLLNSSGNLLVGTTNDDVGAGRLVVERTGGTAASDGAFIVIKNQTAAQAANGAVTPAGGLLFSTYRDVSSPSYTAGVTYNAVGAGGTNTGAQLIFRTAKYLGSNFSAAGNAALPPERARITENGNLLLGTTNDTGYKLVVNGSTNIAGRLDVGAPDQAGWRAYNFNWVQDGFSPQKAYKLATLPASTEATYDHIKLEGVMDLNWHSEHKTPFLITASNRDFFRVKYVYGPSIPARIDFYREVDGSVGVYAVLPANHFCSISLDISVIQATINSNIADIVTPTGTLIWSSQARRSAFNATSSEASIDSYLDAPTIITSNLQKSGTTGTGDIGQSANKFGTVYATTFSGTATTAQYADLAEMYSADADYEPGTVLVFGGKEEVTVTNRYADARVAGVVSTAPAYLMNSGLATGVAVALRGRVPVKVIGQVAKGDLLVASATPGYAVSAGARVELGAAVFAKALSNKTTSDAGIIEAVIL